PVASDGDGPASQAGQTCCQETAAIVGILQGSKGDAGQKGEPGDDGRGLPGKMGPRGFVGPTGETGVKGQKGDIGPRGQRGARGVKGQLGLQGRTGIAGEPGLIGPIGPQGDTGPKGSVGQTGRTGVKGQKGEPGEAPDDSNQRVAFTVVRTSPSDTSTSHTRLPFQATETLLPGTSFDLETGTFTCGVPGTYVFMFSVRKSSSSSNLYVHLRKNGDAVVSGYSTDSSHYEQVSGSAVVVLQRGDTMYITMRGRAYSDSDHRTSFSGFLLYPE
ncbi:complement C1q and tumor necrosis factor-related protein 9-like, partial [Patiria miniata]|uniref:C1q domain-containing protein n=1 Tax=Patiria miniata TaxID=46514 RepID=A0A914B102_PATMI